MTLSVNSPQLDLYGVRISLQFITPIKARSFIGYALRGMLGRALFDKVCIYPQAQCAHCALRSACAYPQAFKPSDINQAHARLPAYVIHDWACSDDQHTIHFSLLFIGSAVQYLELWLDSVLRLSGQLSLCAANQGRVLKIIDLGSGRAIAAQHKLAGQVNPIALNTPYTAHTTLTLHTLLATKHQTADFLFAALRTRLRRLVADYGQGDWALDLPAWQVRSAHLQQAKVRVNNQREIRGVLGTLHLDQISPEAHSLLTLGQYLHAGADAVAGLGRYTLSSG